MNEIGEALAEIRAKLEDLAERPAFRPGYLKGDREAAHYCGMKRDAFRAWVEAESVPHKKINGIRYYKLTILDRRMTPAEARREEEYSG